MKPTSVIFWERNIKTLKKPLIKIKIMNKHKDRPNRNSLSSNKKEKNF